MANQEFPQRYKDMVGKEFEFSGNLFSRKSIERTKFEVVGLRWGSAIVTDMAGIDPDHPTIELLVTNDKMNRSRWTKGFPVREINLSN